HQRPDGRQSTYRHRLGTGLLRCAPPAGGDFRRRRQPQTDGGGGRQTDGLRAKSQCAKLPFHTVSFSCMTMTNRLQIVEDNRFRELVQHHLDSMHDTPNTTPEQQQACIERIKELLVARDAVIVAHYYTDPTIQQLAEETGGIVSDSLEMARFGKNHKAGTLVVCGVKFMGETAKILTPEKKVLMPTLEATCSLDIGCPIEDFSTFCDQHPDRTVVVYANTSAAVKARADWVVTSSIALEVIDYLDGEGEKI